MEDEVVAEKNRTERMGFEFEAQWGVKDKRKGTLVEAEVEVVGRGRRRVVEAEWLVEETCQEGTTAGGGDGGCRW